MTKFAFDDRVVVITGAGRGLGRAYAELLASRGARVLVNDTGGSLQGAGGDASPAEEVVRAIGEAGGEAIVSTDSVATPEGGRAIVEAALDHWGRLDGLIHNAGIVRAAPIVDMTNDELDTVLDVHLRGGFHVAQPAFRRMCADGFGRIVMTSSIGGIYGNHRQVNYGMAKAGLVGLSNVLAMEGAEHGVHCNVIVPGAVTRMAEGLDTSKFPPMGPELVAPVVAWLSHEACSLNGELIVSIAGRVARLFWAETRGVCRPEWTIEDVEESLDGILDASDPFVATGDAHADHMQYSFEMATRTRGGS